MAGEKHARDVNEDRLKTYRYFRIGMIASVALLGASIAIEQPKAGCWQTSISAYYYTPVRSIFVGGLLAIGLSLIVIRARHDLEDALLNVAGALALVVALAPTSDDGGCWSIAPKPLPKQNGVLAEWVVANIDNNIKALLVAGAVGWLIALVIALVTREAKGAAPGLAGGALLLLASARAFSSWDDFDLRAHGYSALAMFAALAVVAGINAWESYSDDHGGYAMAYGAIAASMAIAALVMFPLGSDWHHMVLVLEMTEIGLFGAFWLVQTIEHWDEGKPVTATPTP